MLLFVLVKLGSDLGILLVDELGIRYAGMIDVLLVDHQCDPFAAAGPSSEPLSSFCW